MVYRLIFSPDGKNWINDRANNYTEDAIHKAIFAGRQFCIINKFAKTKVINASTGFVIWDSEAEIENHPDCEIALARARN